MNDALNLIDDSALEKNNAIADFWNILIVDDDTTVHEATEISLSKEIIEGKRIKLLHAYSAKDTRAIFNEITNIAVVLLDVIMEEETTGLNIAKFIRSSIQNKAVRIILRTGQPGLAPETQIFENYDIHDYKEKSQLTPEKLKTSITSAIRAYRDIANEIHKYNCLTNLFISLMHLARGKISVDQCLYDFIQNISFMFHVPIGHIYKFNISQTQNNLSHIWYLNNKNIDFSLFIQKKEQFNFKHKQCAANEAYISHLPYIQRDVWNEPLLSDLESALNQRLIQVLAIPLTQNDSLQAIMEIFITEKFPNIEQTLVIINSAITQFGVILERLNYEEQAKQQYQKLERVLNFLREQQKNVSNDIKDEDNVYLSGKAQSIDNSIDAIAKLNRELAIIQGRLFGIVSAMPSILIGVSAEGKIMDFNKEAESFFNTKIEDAIGKDLQQVCCKLSSFIDCFNAALSSKQVVSKTKLTNIKDNAYYDLIIYPISNIDYSGYVIRIDDITPKVKLQEAMIENEKMISIGGLAAGVSHELNNPIGSIQQNIQNILRRLDAELPANKKTSEELKIDLRLVHLYLQHRNIIGFLDMINSASKRAAYIASNLLEFSRRKKAVKSSFSFISIINNSIELAANDSGIKKKINFHDIKITTDYEKDLPNIYCYNIEIEQVLINLIKNAAQAMGDVKDRKPELYFKLYKDDEFVTLELRDNGPGMGKEILDEIYKPFFTTKPLGEGTGLGLSVSRGIIVENHGGKMEVKSEVGKGTSFFISLPIKTLQHADTKHTE